MESRFTGLILVGSLAVSLIGFPSSQLRIFADKARAGDPRGQSHVRENSLPRSAWPRLLGDNFESVAVGVPKSIDLTEPPMKTWSIDVGDGYGIGSVANAAA